jgi:hypothetical protein
MSDIMEKLEDLHAQATEERSHYYTGSVIREAAREIAALRKENEELKILVREASLFLPAPPKIELPDQPMWADWLTRAKALLQECETHDCPTEGRVGDGR